jgi:hypothetical protein
VPFVLGPAGFSGALAGGRAGAVMVCRGELLV